MDSPFLGFQQLDFVRLHAVPLDIFFSLQDFQYLHDSAARTSRFNAQLIYGRCTAAPGGVVADDTLDLPFDIRQHVGSHRGDCEDVGDCKDAVCPSSEAVRFDPVIGHCVQS